MQLERSIVPIFAEEDTAAERDFHRNGPRGYHDIGLYGDEIWPRFPGQPQQREYDASLEEIHHLFTETALIPVRPDVFDDRQASLSIASVEMEKIIADCGYAYNGTLRWPNCSGFYHYNDRTCDYGCLVDEFAWWVQGTVLGWNDPNNDLGPVDWCEDASREWTLCTLAELRAVSPIIVDAFLSPVGYVMPQVLPDGLYCPSSRPKI